MNPPLPHAHEHTSVAHAWYMGQPKRNSLSGLLSVFEFVLVLLDVRSTPKERNLDESHHTLCRT